MRKLLILALALLGFTGYLRSQSCTTLGQTPATAFPICGTAGFVQNTVPTCLNGAVPTKCNDNAQYSDKNPYWYKFTCYAAGTFGFEISPNTPSDDYDWQLFDVTGHNPSEVYTNPNLYVSANWSSNPGNTGASASSGANGSVNCAGPAFPNQSAMPVLIKGHDYLLLVSHYTDTQSGYSLNFADGTASITNELPPRVVSAQPSCDGTRVNILLNKKMTCASLAKDGSDFTISPSTITITGALSKSCSVGFDMDTVILMLSGTLTPGDYTITTKTGTDGNTLIDNCGTQVPAGITLTFNKPVAPQPTPLDSVTTPGCAPSTLQLVFTKRIHCSTIDPAGKNFTITGPVPVSVTGASGQCDGDNESPIILLQLASPIVTGGVYTITLITPIMDECGQITPVGSSITFNTRDTVAAIFNDQVFDGCRYDTIDFSYQPKNGVNQWQWIFDGVDTINMAPDPMRIYSVFGQKTATLIVSNGVCSDTASASFDLNNGIVSMFEAPNMICPKDLASFVNNSKGDISSWNWSFGDGFGSSLQTPAAHQFPMTGVEEKYPITLIVSNLQCSDTSIQYVDVLRSCYIAVPSAFTPNGDGINDYLYPLNAFKADQLDFKVFNRLGQLVFETNDWTKKWDGTVNGHPQPPGTFVWMLGYVDRDTGRKFFLKGTSVLIR